MNHLPKRLHVVGICGVATSALSIAFAKQGTIVTGSDKGFYPPVSTELTKHNIDFYAGWHPEKMIEKGKPEIIMYGGVGTSPNNAELIYAKEQNIPCVSFAEMIEKYIIKDKSIVIAGTWGKTTTSAILSFIIKQYGDRLSYFVGGIPIDHPSAEINSGNISVVEGDEYQISISDKRPKFAVYKANHLILSSVMWDHADLYPTEKDYFRVFEELIMSIKDDGLIVANIDNSGVRKILPKGNKNLITYGKNIEADFCYSDVRQDKSGLDFKIKVGSKEFDIHSPMFGLYNAENISSAFAMAYKIGIPAKEIINSIANFKGIKRRLERRFIGKVDVLDCHAPTPDKAKAVLQSLKEIYKEGIVAIFEPNIGGRQRASIRTYDNAFKDAHKVIIPRLTKIKKDETKEDTSIESKELLEEIKKTKEEVFCIEEDNELIDFAINNTAEGGAIAFLGSHGFRMMIEETVARLQK